MQPSPPPIPEQERNQVHKQNLTNRSSFAACLIFRTSYSACQHALVLNIYVVFLLMSVVPLVIDAAINDPYEPHGPDPGRSPGGIPETFHQMCLFVFGAMHLMFINPLITLVCGFAAFLAQALTILLRPRGSGPGALSLQGLAAQAVVFGVLAPLWCGRLVFPYDGVVMRVGARADHDFDLFNWLLLVGYVPWDYALFAVAQAGLLWLAVWHGRRRSSPDAPASETDPLLGNETGVGGTPMYT